MDVLSFRIRRQKSDFIQVKCFVLRAAFSLTFFAVEKGENPLGFNKKTKAHKATTKMRLATRRNLKKQKTFKATTKVRLTFRRNLPQIRRIFNLNFFT